LVNAMSTKWNLKERWAAKILYNELESKLLNYEMEDIDKNIKRGSLWYHLIEVENKDVDQNLRLLEEELKKLRNVDSNGGNTQSWGGGTPWDPNTEDDDEDA
jgi:hypothetical protein